MEQSPPRAREAHGYERRAGDRVRAGAHRLCHPLPRARRDVYGFRGTTKKQLQELGDKMPADGKARIEAAAEKLETALKGGSIDDIRTAKDELDRAWSEVSQKMYSGGDSSESSSTNTSNEEKKNVEDADYTIVEDEK